MQPASQMIPSVIRKLCIGTILASACLGGPPANLARKVAEEETANEIARRDYTYRQSVVIEELDKRGMRSGEYKEVRDIIFSPTHERTEQFIGKPEMRLRRLKLTEEDFRDIREIQPFLFTADQLWAYETRYRGEETVDGMDCYVLQVRPRQILQGQRLFDGMVWVNKKELVIVRTYGQAVPQILSMKREKENLFPHFTTVREKVDGKHWFPVLTYADDILPFRGGPIHMRMTIRYSNYKRFAADSTVTFETPK
jgi:hypothetical protein